MAILLIQPAITYPEEQIAGGHQYVRQKEGYIDIGCGKVMIFHREVWFHERKDRSYAKRKDWFS